MVGCRVDGWLQYGWLGEILLEACGQVAYRSKDINLGCHVTWFNIIFVLFQMISPEEPDNIPPGKPSTLVPSERNKPAGLYMEDFLPVRLSSCLLRFHLDNVFGTCAFSNAESDFSISPYGKTKAIKNGIYWISMWKQLMFSLMFG